jgi:hypothetical protein
MRDDEILRLHQQGFVTGAIATHLGLTCSEVRSVVAEASKPHYNAVSPARRKAEAKLAKAQQRLEQAAAELENLNGS